jgi:hypothetical protein
MRGPVNRQFPAGTEWSLRPATTADQLFLFDMVVEAVNWSADRHSSREEVAASWPAASGPASTM